MSKPGTVWANPDRFDPNGFLTRPNLWKTIKDCEEQIKRNIQSDWDYPDDTILPLYLRYRYIARSLVIKYNAQSNAPSLLLNANRLLDDLRVKKAEALKEKRLGWMRIGADIRRLEDFRAVYRVYHLGRNVEKWSHS